jgi:hypothetical protein
MSTHDWKFAARPLDEAKLQAQARLTAAAPDLLAALIVALGALEGAGPLQRANARGMARAAIASATGENAV